MGTVYLGRDPELNRDVAIKVLSTPVPDDQLLERFLREARATAGLRHVNIITVYAVGQFDGQPFIAMEYVDGVSLADVIAIRDGNLAKKIWYLEQICDGLAAAHRAGIIHRDIKPSNVMVDRESIV